MGGELFVAFLRVAGDAHGARGRALAARPLVWLGASSPGGLARPRRWTCANCSGRRRRRRTRQPHGRGGPRDGRRRAGEEGVSVGADCLVFDIETVPDAELGRRLGFEGDDLAVAAQMLAAREEETGSSFLPLEQHRVVAISTLLRSGDQLQVWSLGTVDSPEDDLVRRFFGGIDRLQPTIVSWNGSGFDLPVLHYRMLRHGIASPTYWDTGERDRDFKWNNYLNRFHMRHVDLMDVLAAYQGRGRASLERGRIDRLVGGPGLRRGRRDQERLLVGDAVDFWRVTAVEKDRRLELAAEMRLPGKARLEWIIEPIGDGRQCRLCEPPLCRDRQGRASVPPAGSRARYSLGSANAACIQRKACHGARHAVKQRRLGPGQPALAARHGEPRIKRRAPCGVEMRRHFVEQ